MKLFPPETVTERLASGQWTEGNWDASLTLHAAAAPDRLALIDPDNRSALTDGEPRRLTWAELDVEVDRVAALFVQAGVRADDIIGVQLPNVVEICITYLALARIGAIASPFPVQYREGELGELLELVKAQGFITAARILARANAAAIAELCESIDSAELLFAFGDDVPEGTIRLDGKAASSADLEALAAYRSTRTIESDDCITICWTSGTESTPKGIPRAYIDWCAVGTGCIDSPSMTENDVILNPFPLVNMGAFGGLFCPWIETGCTLVMHHPFDSAVFLGQVSGEKVNYTVMPPALLTRLLQQPETLENWDYSSLRTVGTGSAPVPASTIAGWEGMGIEVINFFGSNEGLNLISDASSVPNPEDRGHLFPSYRVAPEKLRVRLGRHTSIRLVDVATGEDIETPGTIGELRLSGPTVFAGYYEGTGKVGAFDEQGYYRSGDLFEFTDDTLALLAYHGRATDLIVRGGFNVSPSEIELILQDHPSVAEVAIVGMPHAELGERICAFVVPVTGETVELSDLIAQVEHARIAKYKWPEAIVLIDELPRNPVGKVLHRQLRGRLPIVRD